MGQVGEGLSGFRVAQKLDLVEMRGPRYIKVEKGRKEETYLVWVWRNSGAVDLVFGELLIFFKSTRVREAGLLYFS